MENIIIVLDEYSEGDIEKFLTTMQRLKFDLAYLFYIIYAAEQTENIKDLLAITKPKLITFANQLEIAKERIYLDVEYSQSFTQLRKVIEDHQIKVLLAKNYHLSPFSLTKTFLLFNHQCEILLIN